MTDTYEHPAVMLERNIREALYAKYDNYYAEELLLANEHSFVGTQALVTVCRRKILAGYAAKNTEEVRSFEEALPILTQIHSDARLALYGDGNGN